MSNYPRPDAATLLEIYKKAAPLAASPPPSSPPKEPTGWVRITRLEGPGCDGRQLTLTDIAHGPPRQRMQICINILPSEPGAEINFHYIVTPRGKAFAQFFGDVPIRAFLDGSGDFLVRAQDNRLVASSVHLYLTDSNLGPGFLAQGFGAYSDECGNAAAGDRILEFERSR